MSKYRRSLPQLNSKTLLTDGGLATALHFHKKMELPEFASFPLLDTETGRKILNDHFQTYVDIAVEKKLGLLLESVTWRANTDWGAKLGYGIEALQQVNRDSIAMLELIRNKAETKASPMVISGCVGPRGDGYVIESAMTEDEAEAYHSLQIETFANANTDIVTALTLNYAAEAIGIAKAAQKHKIPVAIAFTVETNGELPSEQTLKQSIEAVDEATDCYPAYYMINCAHPTHFSGILEEGSWLERIGGVRANASAKSHAELNESSELDEGDPLTLGTQINELRAMLPNLTVLGGCCGTDHRHIAAIGANCA